MPSSLVDACLCLAALSHGPTVPPLLWFVSYHGFLLIFGDMPLWNISECFVVLPHVSTDVSHRHRCLEEESAFIATETSDVLACLVTRVTTLRLTACHVDTTAAQITLPVCSTQIRVPCPLCATPARRIHSRYTRTLADLPWADVSRTPPAPRPQVVLPQSRLPSSHLCRTAAHGRRPLGAAYAAAGAAPRRTSAWPQGARLGCVSASAGASP